MLESIAKVLIGSRSLQEHMEYVVEMCQLAVATDVAVLVGVLILLYDRFVRKDR